MKTKVLKTMTVLLAGFLTYSLGASEMKKTTIKKDGNNPKIMLRVEMRGSVSSTSLQDLEFRLSLLNEGPEAATVYPKAASLQGPPPPVWDMTVKDQGKSDVPLFRHLRSYYGPPGIPPAGDYIKSQATILKPGEAFQKTLHACFIPRALLAPEHLSISTLDPEGMDGLADLGPLLEKAGVLVLEKTCNDVRIEMARRKDFLRPGHVAFLPGGREYQLIFRYQQSNGMYPFIKDIEAVSPPLRLRIS